MSGLKDLLSTHALHFKRQSIWAERNEEEKFLGNLMLVSFLRQKCFIYVFLQEQAFGTYIM